MPDVQASSWRYLQVYRYQLSRAEAALAMAESEKMSRMTEINKQLVASLKKIIEKCEMEAK